MTKIEEISKGDKFWCNHRKAGSKYILGTVIALTDQPGKLIGLQFEANVSGHSCDGKGKQGYCLWTGIENLLSESEYADHLKTVKSATQFNEFDKISLRKDK